MELSAAEIARARRGEPSARTLLIRTYQDRVYAVCRALAADDALDCAQDTFIKVLTQLDRFDTSRPTPFGAFVIRIARNTCIDIDGKRAFDAVLLRSFDPAARRWWLSYVDDGGRHQLYEGREEAGAWRFYRERLADDGTRVLVRITWTKSATAYSQTIERSTDNGTTWKLGANIAYERR